MEKAYQTNPDKSEVERRAEYFDQLDGHPLALLSKDCMHDNPSERPSTKQLLRALQDIKAEVEGVHGNFTMSVATMEVTGMKCSMEKDKKVRKKERELLTTGDRVRQLHKKLKHVEEVHTRIRALCRSDCMSNPYITLYKARDKRLEEELLKVEGKDAHIAELEQVIVNLKVLSLKMAEPLHA